MRRALGFPARLMLIHAWWRVGPQDFLRPSPGKRVRSTLKPSFSRGGAVLAERSRNIRVNLTWRSTNPNTRRA
jgi:hypothetical protein